MNVDVDGVPAFVFTAGRRFDPALPTALLIHGAAQDHTLFRLEVRRLAMGGWNALAVDLPGHGRSGGVPIVTITDMAAWVSRVAQQIGFESAFVGGHSMGSLISLQLATDRPDMVLGMVLVGAAPAMPVHPRMLDLARAGDHEAVELAVGWTHTGAGRTGRSTQPGFWEPGVSRRMMGASLEVLANDLAACDDHRPVDFERVRCPVVVVAGAVDRMTPARSARQLVESLADAQLVTIPGAGHDIPMRSPRAVVAAFEDLRDRHLGSAVREPM